MSTKIEIFYNKKEDAILIVQDGVLKTYDEAINSSEYLNDFGINKVEEFDNLSGEEIIDVINLMLADFKFHAPLSEVEEYLEMVKNQAIDGVLITTKYI